MDLHLPANAIEEFRYLLERGYPRDRTLELVGNRHDLNRDQRHLMRRALFAPPAARARRAKLIPFADLAGRTLALDAYNVLITLESGLAGRCLIMADDGVVRDMALLSSSYRPGENTGRAMNLMARTLKLANVKNTVGLFLSSMSKSGELAASFREVLKRAGVDGECRTERAVEPALPLLGDVVATANSAIMERADRVFDLAGYIIARELDIRVEGL